MKKLLMIGSTLALLSSSAYATQARLLALGMNETDNEGMYYIQDQRNVFLNSAYVNYYADSAVMEWGSSGLNVTATVPTNNGAATVDQNHRPKAQGGVFKKFGDLVYGVYLGNESNTSSLLRIAATQKLGLAKPIPTADNQLDLFVAGDAGLKWGANLTFAKNENTATDTQSEDSALATRFGVIGNGWDAHANISLNSESETLYASAAPATSGKQEFDGKLGLHIGGSFNIAESTKVFGYVKHYGWDQKATGLGALNAEGDFTSYYLGIGGDMTVNTNGKIFYGLTAKKTDINLDFANKGEVRHLIVPINIGYEAVATEWLTFRGSIVQNLWGKQDNKRVTGTTDLNAVASNLIGAIYGGTGEKTIAASTEVNAGASLTFGNLAVDGMVGLTSSDRGTGSTTTATGTANKNQGLLTFDNLASRVGVTYKF